MGRLLYPDGFGASSSACELESAAIVDTMPEVRPQSDARTRRQVTEVQDRLLRFIRQRSQFQQERLCRSLSLTSSQTSYASILSAIQKDGALRRVTQLINLSREVIMDFFQEVAGHYPLDRYVLRQLPMSEMKHWLEQVLLQGCTGLVKELRMYVRTPKTSDEEARYLRKIVRFDRTSRSQVMAYFTRPCMAGAVEELAKKLRVPCHHYNRMERVLKQHKEAHTGEHHLMQGILTVLSGRHGPYFLLASMDSRHRRGLLIHMGQDASGLNYKQVERAIMCAWADQAHPFIDKVPEPAINLQQTRVPESALQQSAPSGPALQHHGSAGFAATHSHSFMQQEVQQPGPSSNANRPGLANATAAKIVPAVAAMLQPPQQYAAKHALPCHAQPFMDGVHTQAKEMLSQNLLVQSSPDWQRVHAELQQLAASSKYRLQPFAQEHSAALQQVAALHGSSTAGDIGGLERNAAAHDGRGDFLQCDAGSANRAGPSDIQRLGTAAETKPASSSYPGISCDNRCEPAIMVLDLDACLARTTFQETVASGVEPVLEGLLRFEAQLSDAQRSLFRLDSLGLWVKLRPGVHQLLQMLHGRFQTWAFTSATLLCGQAMLALLDPTSQLLGGRIIVGEALGAAPARLFTQRLEGKEELSLILGSIPERWPHHQANFVPITKYSFPGFCTRADSQDTDQQGECSISGPLAYAAWMSTKVHDCMVESWRQPIAEQGTSASSAVRLPSWDARYVLQQERLQVLEGVSICFDGFDANDDPGLAQLKSLAQTFGARCSSSRYSRIIGLRYTAKMRDAEAHRVPVVCINWLLDCVKLWQKLPEREYKLKPCPIMH